MFRLQQKKFLDVSSMQALPKTHVIAVTKRLQHTTGKQLLTTEEYKKKREDIANLKQREDDKETNRGGPNTIVVAKRRSKRQLS